MVQQNQKIDFRLATVDDLDYICEVELMPENIPFIGHDSLEKHQTCLKNPDCKYWIAEIQVEGQNSSHSGMKKVGFGIIKGCKNPYQSMELYRIALSEKAKGFGSKFIQFIQDFAFNICTMHRLWLDVLTTNTRAINVYEKWGFIREGCLRECSKAQSGEYESLYLYSMLSHEYR